MLYCYCYDAGIGGAEKKQQQYRRLGAEENGAKEDVKESAYELNYWFEEFIAKKAYLTCACITSNKHG